MDIYVIDTETTGLDGATYGDKVLEIAICKVNPQKRTIKKVYESIVGHNTEEWNEYLSNAWVFGHSDLTLEMVSHGPPAEKIIKKVNKILKNKKVTAFNTAFDFNRFLDQDPWKIPYEERMPCIMKSATGPCGIERYDWHGLFQGYKWPNLNEAYYNLVKSEDGGKAHRAMADCYKSAQVLLKLIQNNQYQLEIKKGEKRKWHHKLKQLFKNTNQKA